jgi:hypothetical protein
MDKVESFYRECCEGCQEQPDKGIATAFKVSLSFFFWQPCSGYASMLPCLFLMRLPSSQNILIQKC